MGHGQRVQRPGDGAVAVHQPMKVILEREVEKLGAPGDVVTVPHWRNPHAATPAVPGHGDVPTVPAKRATPAVPAHKGGQSGNHRP